MSANKLFSTLKYLPQMMFDRLEVDNRPLRRLKIALRWNEAAIRARVNR
jgi:hypothetical protein